tara:strand:+ start:387 stop:551 length:165 start_codon:yes stop_codon:yes gene_type:complete
MPTPQERLVTEEADLKALVEEYNGVVQAQQEQAQVIIKKQARVELLKEQVAEID